MTDVFAKALLKQFVINKHFETTFRCTLYYLIIYLKDTKMI